MAGYVRQDISNEIETGETIQAPPLDAEFDAIVAAFSAASGHKHNGASGEGAPITVVGPSQNIVVSANSLTPSTDDFMDLGSSTSEFKNLWIDGTANIDLLVADAGTIGGANITTASNTQTLTNKTIDLTDNTLIASSAELAAAITDETGTDALVFANSPALTGVPTAPTAAAATNTTQLATTAHVFAERSNVASLTNKTIDLTNNTLVATSAQLRAAVTDETGTGNLVFSDSPALGGIPTAPTAAAATNTTQVATTAHVFAERSNSATLTNKTLTSPTINGGTITGITDLAVADGGTGASDAATARTNLGVAIGSNVQAYDATLASISNTGTAADRMIYTTGVDTWAETVSTSFGRSLMDDADATAGRSTLGLGTIATQNAASVTITGGSISGITDLGIADGGTGASTAAGALTNFGLTATAAEINKLSGVTATTAEINKLAGLTATTSQLNVLATIPGGLTGTELGYMDGVTSSVQAQLDAKPTVVGLQTIWLPSGSFIPTTTGGAAYAGQELATNKVMIQGYDFDAATENKVQTMIAMPKSWNEGTVTAQIFWKDATTAGTGDVIWGVRAFAVGDDDALDTSFGTGQTVTDTFITSNDLHITTVTSAITIAGSPAENDLIVVEAYRNAAAGGDTYTQLARFIGLKLFYSVNAGNDT